MSDDLLELNDMELNYIYFGDETDCDDASKNAKCQYCWNCDLTET